MASCAACGLLARKDLLLGPLLRSALRRVLVLLVLVVLLVLLVLAVLLVPVVPLVLRVLVVPLAEVHLLLGVRRPPLQETRRLHGAGVRGVAPVPADPLLVPLALQEVVAGLGVVVVADGGVRDEDLDAHGLGQLAHGQLEVEREALHAVGLDHGPLHPESRPLVLVQGHVVRAQRRPADCGGVLLDLEHDLIELVADHLVARCARAEDAARRRGKLLPLDDHLAPCRLLQWNPILRRGTGRFGLGVEKQDAALRDSRHAAGRVLRGEAPVAGDEQGRGGAAKVLVDAAREEVLLLHAALLVEVRLPKGSRLLGCVVRAGGLAGGLMTRGQQEQDGEEVAVR
mmetsp:Transcript_30314/g.82060  ORF Transcript_30314/g.82060 Transcript_30314/m.82060 type:complete len:342 (-) Transcript_30314:102-1127(-)